MSGYKRAAWFVKKSRQNNKTGKYVFVKCDVYLSSRKLIDDMKSANMAHIDWFDEEENGCVDFFNKDSWSSGETEMWRIYRAELQEAG